MMRSCLSTVLLFLSVVGCYCSAPLVCDQKDVRITRLDASCASNVEWASWNLNIDKGQPQNTTVDFNKYMECGGASGGGDPPTEIVLLLGLEYLTNAFDLSVKQIADKPRKMCFIFHFADAAYEVCGESLDCVADSALNVVQACCDCVPSQAALGEPTQPAPPEPTSAREPIPTEPTAPTEPSPVCRSAPIVEVSPDYRCIATYIRKMDIFDVEHALATVAYHSRISPFSCLADENTVVKMDAFRSSDSRTTLDVSMQGDESNLCYIFRSRNKAWIAKGMDVECQMQENILEVDICCECGAQPASFSPVIVGPPVSPPQPIQGYPYDGAPQEMPPWMQPEFLPPWMRPPPNMPPWMLRSAPMIPYSSPMQQPPAEVQPGVPPPAPYVPAQPYQEGLQTSPAPPQGAPPQQTSEQMSSQGQSPAPSPQTQPPPPPPQAQPPMAQPPEAQPNPLFELVSDAEKNHDYGRSGELKRQVLSHAENFPELYQGEKPLVHSVNMVQGVQAERAEEAAEVAGRQRRDRESGETHNTLFKFSPFRKFIRHA